MIVEFLRAEFNGRTVSTITTNVTAPPLSGFSLLVDQATWAPCVNSSRRCPTEDMAFLIYDVGHSCELPDQEHSTTDFTLLTGRLLEVDRTKRDLAQDKAPAQLS